MRWVWLTTLLLVAAGCGDDGAPAVDTSLPVPDARVTDAPVDAPPPLPCSGCELCAEQNAGNEFVDDQAISGDELIAMKFRLNLTRNVRYIQVFTGEVNGASTMRIYTTAAGTGEPDTQIGFGNFNMGVANGWQGAAMDTPVSVAANTDHWFAWFALDGAQASRAPMGMAVNFRESTDDGASWTAESAATLKYRIYCDP